MNRQSIRAAGLLALVIALGGCGSATALGTTMLTGLFTNTPGSVNDVATVNAQIRSNDAQEQLLQVVTEEGLRGVVRWDVQTQVVHGTETYGAVALQPGDQVQLRLRRTSDVDIYTDYVLVRQRAAAAAADTAIIQLEGTVSDLDADRGRFRLRTAGGRSVLVTLPYNPPADVAERFGTLSDGDPVRVTGRYVAEDRFELTRFEP